MRLLPKERGNRERERREKAFPVIHKKVLPEYVEKGEWAKNAPALKREKGATRSASALCAVRSLRRP